jgi:hypothetical protein
MRQQGRTINDIINDSNKNKSSMTKCSKGGVKIKDAGNTYKENPFAGVNPFSNPNEERNISITYNKSGYESLDLNIESYSREDLFNLFGLKNMNLTEDVMKECKNILKNNFYMYLLRNVNKHGRVR